MTDRNLAIRLSVVDGGKVKADLQDIGDSGQKALQKIEQAGTPASKALEALNAATSNVKGRFEEMTGSLGPLGSALAEIGPYGLAAGAAFALIGETLAKSLEVASEAEQSYNRLWDGAEVEIFFVNWQDLTQGKIILKRGTIGHVELQDAVFKAELRGMTQQLQQQIVELFTPDCRADLGDSRCKVNLSALTVIGTVTAATDRYGFTDSARTEADSYWNGGLVTWTSGANQGRKMEIGSFSGGVFSLYLPVPGVIAVGDAYSLQPGCDKSFTTCKNRYGNGNNFRGEPYIPGSDIVYNYPDSKS